MLDAKTRLENGIADLNSQLEETTDKSVRAGIIRCRLQLEQQLRWVIETEERFCSK